MNQLPSKKQEKSPPRHSLPLNRANSAPIKCPHTKAVDSPDQEMLYDPVYYFYYYSLKEPDPRLPKPLFKPPVDINPLMIHRKEIDLSYIQHLQNCELENIKIQEIPKPQKPICKEKNSPIQVEPHSEEWDLESLNFIGFLNTSELLMNSKNKHISLQIQSFIRQAQEIDLLSTYTKLQSNLIELSYDPLGNYIVQLLIDRDVQVINEMIHKQFKDKYIRLCQNNFSCRVVQKQIEICHKSSIFEEIFDELFPSISFLITDQNGNHVVQRFIDYPSSNRTKLLLSYIEEKLAYFLNYPFGCKVFQKIIQQKLVDFNSPLIELIVERTSCLSRCQYGNYIVQSLLQQKSSKYIHRLVDLLSADFISLSKNKFASNVIEKCLVITDEKQRQRIFDALFNKKKQFPYERTEFLDLINNPFGNYVIRKLFELLSQKEKIEFCRNIPKNQLKQIISNQDSYGKHVAIQIQNVIVKYNL